MTFTPKQALALTKPTSKFLCPVSANEKYGIEFKHFVIRDYETKEIFFEVGGGDNGDNGDNSNKNASGFENEKQHRIPKRRTSQIMEVDPEPDAMNQADIYRKIRYTLHEKVLKLDLVSTGLTFKVNGKEPLTNFRMIERHYYKDELIKSYDFSFAFCIPGSTNEWEQVYRVPKLDSDLVEMIVDSPFETKSDSFYFVEDELIMHNKVSYKYLSDSNNDRSYKGQHSSSISHDIGGDDSKESSANSIHGRFSDTAAEAKMAEHELRWKMAEAKISDDNCDYGSNANIDEAKRSEHKYTGY